MEYEDGDDDSEELWGGRRVKKPACCADNSCVDSQSWCAARRPRAVAPGVPETARRARDRRTAAPPRAPRETGAPGGRRRAARARRFYKKPHKNCHFVKEHDRTHYYCSKHKYMDESEVQVMDACPDTCKVCGGYTDIVDKDDVNKTTRTEL
jgi:hypothetical protein